MNSDRAPHDVRRDPGDRLGRATIGAWERAIETLERVAVVHQPCRNDVVEADQTLLLSQRRRPQLEVAVTLHAEVLSNFSNDLGDHIAILSGTCVLSGLGGCS